MKLEYPQYYRLTRNMIQLIKFFSSNYGDIIQKFGEENLYNLEKDMSKLLTKHDLKSDGYLKTYLREVQSTSEQIEEEMIKSSANTDNVGLFQLIIREGLREKTTLEEDKELKRSINGHPPFMERSLCIDNAKKFVYNIATRGHVPP